MMAQKNFIVLLVMIACCSISAMAQKPNATKNDADPNEVNIDEIVNMCNESFHTSGDYLVDLNTTGSFPDETDKTPMCFIRCYLNSVGILKEDELDREKAIEMNWSTSEEALDECYTEVADRTNPCHKAYFLTRCVMMRNLVDTRTTKE